ncbi:MAG: hypothetical protein QOD83_2718 [Solirubrobacteraceae bacterium]|nr:hypothetical protein [Solirubrobacteraceae bacterium]
MSSDARTAVAAAAARPDAPKASPCRAAARFDNRPGSCVSPWAPTVDCGGQRGRAQHIYGLMPTKTAPPCCSSFSKNRVDSFESAGKSRFTGIVM